jgi:hypothetical protein
VLGLLVVFTCDIIVVEPSVAADIVLSTTTTTCNVVAKLYVHYSGRNDGRTVARCILFNRTIRVVAMVEPSERSHDEN